MCNLKIFENYIYIDGLFLLLFFFLLKEIFVIFI